MSNIPNTLKVFKDAITENDANYLITLFESSNDYVMDQGRLILSNPITDEVKNIIKKCYNTVFDYHINQGNIGPEKPHVADFIVIKSTTGDECKPHTDFTEEYGRQFLTTMIYLNDDFEGGELYFPEIDMSYKPEKYSIISFPADIVHAVSPVISGTRYAAGMGSSFEQNKIQYPVDIEWFNW
jgi:hypothetical protein